jgi:hypothetical protein
MRIFFSVLALLAVMSTSPPAFNTNNTPIVVADEETPIDCTQDNDGVWQCNEGIPHAQQHQDRIIG